MVDQVSATLPSTFGKEGFGTTHAAVDTIDEFTAATGVTIDGVLLKDGGATLTGAIAVTGGITAATGGVTITAGNLTFNGTSQKIVQPTTSLVIRDHGDANTNATILDNGNVTLRGDLAAVAGTFSGAVSGTTGAFSGAITPTGGVASAGGFTLSPRGIHSGGVTATQTTDGNDSTPVITETYICEVIIPANMTITGIAFFNGSAVGTDKLVGILFNSSGVVVANTALAGTTATGTDAFQKIDLTATYAAKGPATYYIGLQVNGTTYRFNSHILGVFGASKKTGETFGTPTTITAPTTFTTALGPIASLY